MTLAPFRIQESAQTAALSVTHAPIGKGGKNWITRLKPGNTGQMPAYIQNVRNAIMRGGVPESRATAIAVGRVRDWAEGKGNVSAEVKAAAAKAIAEWDADRAKSHAMSAVKESYVGAHVDRLVREAALADLVLLERRIGLNGMVAALGPELREAAAWTPTLKRTASASRETERHDVYDGAQHVGVISKARKYSGGNRFEARAINGDQVGGYELPSQDAAVQALQKHLEEAPARVGQHSNGKWLAARPTSYDGQTTYREYPSETTARFAAGLPERPTVPEKNTKVAAMTEQLELNLITLSGVDIPPLRRVQEARRGRPFRLSEEFNPDELRDFKGQWIGGGRHKLSALPDIGLKDLPGSVGSGRWDAGAKRATRDIQAGKVEDTEHAHRKVNADGSLGPYSPARQALHEEILARLFQGKQKHPAEARAIFTAGGPASGKSSITDPAKGGEVDIPKDVVHVNPDVVREMLPEYQALKAAGRTDASSLTHEEASTISKAAMRVALEHKFHTFVDTVGAGAPGKFAGKVKAAQDAGHQVSVHYATTSVDEAMKRAAARGRRTGRHVPESYLRTAHHEVSARFPEITQIPGVHVQVYDTTNAPAKLIAERKRESDNMLIADRKAYQAFLRKAKAGKE